MLADVQQSYKLARPFQGAGNPDRAPVHDRARGLCDRSDRPLSGRLPAGRLGQDAPAAPHLGRAPQSGQGDGGEVVLSADKRRITLTALIEAMFYDLTPGDRAKVKVPRGTEGRERDLQILAVKRRRPVVLVIDEVHDLCYETLTGLKRLMEIVADSGMLMSLLIVGASSARELPSPPADGGDRLPHNDL